MPDTTTQTAQIRPKALVSSTSHPVSNYTYSAEHGVINVTNNYYGDKISSHNDSRKEVAGPGESEHVVSRPQPQNDRPGSITHLKPGHQASDFVSQEDALVTEKPGIQNSREMGNETPSPVAQSHKAVPPKNAVVASNYLRRNAREGTIL
jgi:hypothetical protein